MHYLDATKFLAMKNSTALRSLLIGGLLIIFSFSTSAFAQIKFEVSNKLQSDARVEINWDYLISLPNRVGNDTLKNPPAYIQVREWATKKEIYSEIIDSIYNFKDSQLVGSTVTFIRPNQSVVYELRVLEYGPGTPFMDSIFDTAQTLPFLPPTLNKESALPWSIRLPLKGNSQYHEKMFLYRTSFKDSRRTLISVLDTSAIFHEDICNPLDTVGIINGELYSYELVSVNTTNSDTSAGSFQAGFLYRDNFEASKNGLDGKVRLTWNNFSQFVDEIRIKRDGVNLVELRSDDTYFEDLEPVPGYNHRYLLELYSEGELRITFVDTGSIIPNGKISGWVFNQSTDDFTVPNQKVTASANVRGEVINLETVTDANGYYKFDSLSYFRSAQYTLTINGVSEAVNLNLDDPVKQRDFLIDVVNEKLDNGELSISEFKSESNDSLGEVKLTWSSTVADTLFYLLYRGDDLIHIGNGENEFIDLEGEPLVRYEYKIRAFERNYDELTQKYKYYFHEDLTDSAQYPRPQSIKDTDFVVLPNTTRATVDLSWQHPQGNIEGFRIFRNDSFLATLPKSELSYVDSTGMNGENYVYSMLSYKLVSDTICVDCNSLKTYSSTVKYPTLTSPTIGAVESTSEGFVKVNWSYGVDAQYNYTGFNVLRILDNDTQTIATIRKSLPFEYTDIYGVPNSNYLYAIEAFKNYLYSKSRLVVMGSPITYPQLPKVKVDEATNPEEGLVYLKTTLPESYHYLGVGVIDDATQDTLLTFSGSQTESYIGWNDYQATSAGISIYTFKEVDGERHYASQDTNVTIGLSQDGPYDLDTVANLRASTDYSSHVKISWEYPNYYIPYFFIYRDGILLDSLEGVLKVYYDRVEDNDMHYYQVQVRIDDRKSPRIGAYGKRIGQYILYGSAVNNENKQGVEGATVRLYLMDSLGRQKLFNQTLTNGTGYFEFNEIPGLNLKNASNKLVVDITHPNARFDIGKDTLDFYDSIYTYTSVFLDTLEAETIPSDTITGIKDLIAVPNPQNQTVNISWQATNSNYTSFEVYRGLVLIATVQANQTKLVVDDEGLPGYDYRYRIKPIWQKNRFTRIEQDFYAVTGRFPTLLPVQDLSATVLNDKVRINWSHPVDLNLFYEVLRNNEVYAVVSAGEPLEIEDTSGTVGQIYKYTVTPVLRSNSTIRAIEQSITSVFPSVKQIKDLTLSNVPNGVKMEWKAPSERTSIYKIYVNGNVVDTVESSGNGMESYISYHGIPSYFDSNGVVSPINQYAVAPGYQLGDDFYFGKKLIATNRAEWLVAVDNIFIEVESDNDQIKIFAEHDYEGVDGIEFRSYSGTTRTNVLGSVRFEDKDSGIYQVNFNRGIPSHRYELLAVPYSNRNGIKYYGVVTAYRAGATNLVTFPRLSAPKQVMAVDSHGLYRTISWKHGREDIQMKVIADEGGIIRELPLVQGNLNQLKDASTFFERRCHYSLQAMLLLDGDTILSKTVESNVILNNIGKDIYTAGHNNFGQLGKNSTQNDDSWFELINNDHDWTHISAGENNSMAIKTDGTLWAWGYNNNGLLGVNSTLNEVRAPLQVGTDDDWVYVWTSGTLHNAIKEDGSLWAWGRGQVIVLGSVNSTTPLKIGTDNDWEHVVNNGYTTMAVKKNGTLWGTGDNIYGLISTPSGGTFDTFIQIGSDTNWRTVSLGVSHAAGIKKDGTIFTWGLNDNGRLGQGNLLPKSVPTQAGSDNDWAKVVCSKTHTYAIKQNTKLYIAGDLNNGQAGIGSGDPNNNNLTYVKNWSLRWFGTKAYDVNSSIFALSPIGDGLDTTSAIIVGLSRNLFGTGRNSNGQLGLGLQSQNDELFRRYWTLNAAFADSLVFTKISIGNSHSVGLALSSPMKVFAASDGIFKNKVDLEWTDVSANSDVNAILIYRDAELISRESSSSVKYTDFDAIPGRRHAYSAVVEFKNKTKSSPISDIGWNAPDGSVRGNVISLIGSQPVPGVNLKLKIEAEEGNFYYETQSDQKGNFRFENVYYGKLANVSVSASYLDHQFSEDTLFGIMDDVVKDLTIGTFIDETANLITGTVSRLGSDCRLDSIPISLVKHYSNGNDVIETEYTTPEGNYVFNVNPFENDLLNFELVLADTVFRGGDTIRHSWDTNHVIIDKNLVSPRTPEQNFVDELAIPYQFIVRNTCARYPNTRFTVEVISEDGCFSKTIVSDSRGKLPLQNLPPLKYIANVTAATPLSVNIIPVLDYLAVRPARIDLSSYNKNGKGDSVLLGAIGERKDFVYHNKPSFELEMKSGIERVSCNDNTFVVQGSPNPRTVKVNLKVLETHLGTTCHVDEGFLLIRNAGAINPNQRLDYDSVIGGFPVYEFTPGLPATISPFYKPLIVEYHTQLGYVSEQIYPLIIKGQAPQPGSDVIVAQEEGKDFQIPLFVLRDPPGDNSYSYLEKGVETTSQYSLSKSVGGSVGLFMERKLLIAGIGPQLDKSIEAGGEESNTNTFSISATTNQRFETSSASDLQTSDANEYLVGDNADVIVGTGVALKYGIIEIIDYDSDSCSVSKISQIGISPDNLKTTWVYTVSQIEALIREYQNALQLAKQGRLTFAVNEGGKDTSYYRTLIANWQSVLRYHRLNTLPHYNLCDKKVFNNLFPENNDNAKAARSFQEDCFCKRVGEYQGDSFILNEDFKWDDNLMNRYKIARDRIDRLYAKDLAERDDATSNANEDVNTDSYEESELNNYLNNLSPSAKDIAENITFGGNVTLEKSSSFSATSSETYTQQVNTNSRLYFGVATELELKLGTFAGLGGGVTVEKTTELKLEAGTGLATTFEFVRSWDAESSAANTSSRGYVLSDDDQGDQFSVTVINGLEQSHTAYFETFAGRSSCPYEPGTIPRDRPQLTVEYPDGTLGNNILRNVNVEDPAFFPLKISNLASEVFNEPRYYNLVQAANSNQNGAQLTADGSGQYYPLVYKVNSGSAVYTGFYANKAGSAYDYPDLNMQLIPTCLSADADLVDGFNGAELHMEAYFRKPCSNVSIINPGNNWVINRTRDIQGAPSDTLLITIGDFDPENEFMENIFIEYRRIGTPLWKPIQGLSISKDSLNSFLSDKLALDPTYTFIWDILGKSEFIDGEYELRAVVQCGLQGKVESNIVKGTIDRTSIRMFGTPYPRDGVLNIGENVMVEFSEPVQCGLETKANAHYSFVRKRDGRVLEFTPNCAPPLRVEYTFDGDLDTLDNEVIVMQVFDVEDLNGNKMTDTINYEFIISRTPVEWQPFSYEIDVYRGESKDFNLELVNTGAIKANVDISATGTPLSLLEILRPQDSLFQFSRADVPLRLNAQGVNIGTYTFDLGADIRTPLKDYGRRSIPLKVNVLASPPNWNEPTGKTLSTVVVCNFEIDSVRSMDTMDRIAITLNNEIRGTGSILRSRANSNLFYAIISVQGDSADLRFKESFGYRIWDASQGAEYDGVMRGAAIKFDGGIHGSTFSPRIISVDSEWDSVRYIPLFEGWNWLAFNYKKRNMSIDSMLPGLQLTGGEIIKTLDGQAIYNDSSQSWFSTSNGFNSVNTINGYHLFMNDDDILRVSGANADFRTVVVNKGWNLIGNPYQTNVDVNSVFRDNSKLEEGAILKTGGVNSKVSILESNDQWNGSVTEYEVNRSYMIYNEKSTQLLFRNNDCNSLVKENYQFNMTILGSVQFDWTELQEEGAYVVAQIDGVCRGRGIIEEVNTPARRFVLSLFVYGDTADLGKRIEFKIFRPSKNEWYDAYTKEELFFTADLHRGLPYDPFWFSNDADFVNVDKPKKKYETLDCMLFPNPFTTEFSIKLNAIQSGNAEVKVYDAFGREVHHGNYTCSSGLNEFKVMPSYLAAGVYTVSVRLNNTVKTVRMVKRHNN